MRTPLRMLTEMENANEVMKELRERVVTDIEHTGIKQALLMFFKTYENDMATLPGGHYHHATVHGLVRHTLEVEEYCKYAVTSQHLEDINTDVLYAAAFWHDIGKIFLKDDQSNHAIVGADVATRYMLDAGVETLLVCAIADSIRCHMCVGTTFITGECEHKYAESRILHGADSLSAFTEFPKDNMSGLESGGSRVFDGYGRVSKI